MSVLDAIIQVAEELPKHPTREEERRRFEKLKALEAWTIDRVRRDRR